MPNGTLAVLKNQFQRLENLDTLVVASIGTRVMIYGRISAPTTLNLDAVVQLVHDSEMPRDE